MSASAATLLLPAPDSAWRVWKPRAGSPGDAVENPAAFSDAAKPFIVGLPASACRTIGLILPQSDEEVMEQMIAAQLEKRGIKLESGAAKKHRWHHLGASGPLAVVSVDVLAEPFPEHLAAAHAANYTAALRLAQFPPGHLVIAEEQGDWVIAAGHQGRLFHSHVCAQAPAEAADLAREIELTRLALESQPAFGTVSGVTLAGSWERDFAASLDAATGLPVQVVSQLSPSTSLDTGSWAPLLPSAVRDAKTAAARKGKIIRWSIIASALFAGLTILGFIHLGQLDRRADDLAAEVSETAPAAAEVRQTMERWKALSPALEHRRYPLVLLSDMTSLMPPSGIVLREFEAKVDEIDIRGEARDAQLYFQFIEDLQKHKNLSRYEWSKSQPTVREKTASFRTQGKLKP